MGQARRRSRRPSRFTIGLFLAVVATGLLIGFLDFEKAWETVRAADVRWLAAALAASAVSYVFLAWSYGWIFTRMGIELPMRQVMLVGYTSSALNHLMPVPTVAGHGIRVALLRDRGISPGDTLAASAFHSFLSSFVLLSLFPIGLAFVLLTRDLPSAAEFPLAAITGLTIVLLAGMTWIIFHTRARRATLQRIGSFLDRFIHERDVKKNIADFDDTIENGITLLTKRRFSFLIAVLLDLGDWVFTALTLWFSFLAFGHLMDPGTLLTGFVVGIVVGLQSLVPGGIGLQEASMAGTYALLDVPFHLAVLTALLFRGVYQIVPFMVGLVTYAKLMHRPFQIQDLRRARRHEMVEDE